MPAPHTPTPWLSNYPEGGLDLFPDADSCEPIASFEREEDCVYARHCVNTHAALVAALEASVAAEKAKEAAFAGGPTSPNYRALADAAREARERFEQLRAAALATQPQP